MESEFKGKLRQRCSLCGRKAWYVSRLVCALVVKNRLDGDTLMSLTAGALLCNQCCAHNGCERKANPLPLATTFKKCHRCSGSRVVPDPSSPGRWESRDRDGRAHPGPIANSSRRVKKCPVCDGEGRVPAVELEAAS